MKDLEKNEIQEQNANTVVNADITQENEEVIPSMDDFKDLLNKSFKKIYTGDILDCSIITVTDKELLVNIGYASDGIIPITETFANEEESITDLYKEGDVVKAEVIQKDDGDGNVLLSIKKAAAIVVWDELETLKNEERKFDVKVKEVVKGGVVCDIKGIRAFIPASQLSANYVEDLDSYLGKSLRVKVMELDKEKNKVILSHKEVEKEEIERKKKRLFQTIKKDDPFKGKVVKLMNFGAFVDIGGVQGLIHNSDLSWKRVKHPSDILNEGDIVDVYVIDVDYKNEKISLGLKQVDDPAENSINKLVIGNIYEGKVERLTPYGAFVSLEDGLEGLVHISQLSEKRINAPAEVVHVGDTVKVKVIDIDQKDKKIKLSMRDLDVLEEDYNQYASNEEATTSLKDVFKVFLKDIDK